MNDRCVAPLAANLDGIWASLTERGYAITDEASLGLPATFRETFSRAYFNDWTLRHDEGDWPADRERARDVIFYRWQEDILELYEFDTITIIDRASIAGRRDHARVLLTQDQLARQLVRALLMMVPPYRRQGEGTFGVNLFRTYTNVVTAPHHEHEQFVITYVVDRIGEGAETYLYYPEDVREDGKITGDPILRQRLTPGQLIIFEDEMYKHGATPLHPSPGGMARRDAVVCTVDYHDTYLSSSSVLTNWVSDCRQH